ncbi:hypothetical protein Tco_1333354 [Tanacetum coccineum]
MAPMALSDFENEVIFTDKIVVLKSDASFNEAKIITLKTTIENLKKEKEDNLLKINNYDNATKSLDKVIGSQLIDNNKKGLGYNAIPPPPTGLFVPPIIDLSYSSIEKFKEPEFEDYGVKVLDDEEHDVSKPKSEKKTVIPTVKKIEFVKAKQDDKTVRNTVKYADIQVNTARPKAVVNAVRTNRVNVVKASACWVWRPIKPNSASITLKRYDYINARGRYRLGYEAAVKLHDQFDDEKRAGAELTQQND